MQCDSRGQIVIPKDLRRELGIEEGSGFWMFSLEKEGLLLKKIEEPELEKDKTTTVLKKQSTKMGVSQDAVLQTVKRYKRTNKGGLEEV